MKALASCLLVVVPLTLAGCDAEPEHEVLHMRQADGSTIANTATLGIRNDSAAPPLELTTGDLVGFGPRIYRVGGPAPESSDLAMVEYLPFLRSGDNLLVHSAQGDSWGRLLGADDEGNLILVGSDEESAEEAGHVVATDAGSIVGDILGLYQDAQTCIAACMYEAYSCRSAGGDKWCCSGYQAVCSAGCGVTLGATVPPGIGVHWAAMCSGSKGGGVGGGVGGADSECSGTTIVTDLSVTIETEDGTLYTCRYDGALKQVKIDGVCVSVMDGGSLTGCTEMAPGSGPAGGPAQTAPAWF